MDIFVEAAVGAIGAVSTFYDYIATGYKAVSSYIQRDIKERREADEAFNQAKETLEGRLD